MENSQNNTSPEPEPVTEFNGNGDQVTPSRLPLIRQSPLAQLPMQQALEHMAQVDGDSPPAGVDPVAACAFKRSVIRRRVMTVQWKGVSFLTVCYNDVLWSPKLETGIVLDWDPIDEIYIASEIRALTSEEVANAIATIDGEYGRLGLGAEVSLLVDRNLISEAALTDTLVGYYPGTPDEARLTCQGEMKQHVRWVDQIGLDLPLQAGDGPHSVHSPGALPANS